MLYYIIVVGIFAPRILNGPCYVVRVIYVMVYHLLARFWTDNWLGTSLTERLQLPQQLWPRLTAPSASYIHNGAWRIPDCIQEIDSSVVQQIQRVILPVAALPDRMIWCNSKDGQLSTKQATLHLSTTVTVPWAVWLWKKSIRPSNSFVSRKLPLRKEVARTFVDNV
ncbi:hypothetical protein L195_g043416, partial [Trifolium pratense]